MLDKETPQPLNVSSLQTAFLRIHGVLTVPYSEEIEQDTMLPGYLRLHVSEPRVFQVELRGLEDRKQPHLLPTAAAA